jgi:antitoxin VapB
MGQQEREVSLFRNGRNQAIRIPREFELEGNKATIKKVGNQLIIEPIDNNNLLALLNSWEPLAEALPGCDDVPVEPEDIF